MLNVRKKQTCKSWQNLDISAEMITFEPCSKEVNVHQKKKRVQEVQKDCMWKAQGSLKNIPYYCEVPGLNAQSIWGGLVSNKSGNEGVKQLAELTSPSFPLPWTFPCGCEQFITTAEQECLGKVVNESAWFAHSKLVSYPSPPNLLPLKEPGQSKSRSQGLLTCKQNLIPPKDEIKLPWFLATAKLNLRPVSA